MVLLTRAIVTPLLIQSGCYLPKSSPNIHKESRRSKEQSESRMEIVDYFLSKERDCAPIKLLFVQHSPTDN